MENPKFYRYVVVPLFWIATNVYPQYINLKNKTMVVSTGLGT